MSKPAWLVSIVAGEISYVCNKCDNFSCQNILEMLDHQALAHFRPKPKSRKRCTQKSERLILQEKRFEDKWRT